MSVTRKQRLHVAVIMTGSIALLALFAITFGAAAGWLPSDEGRPHAANGRDTAGRLTGSTGIPG